MPRVHFKTLPGVADRGCEALLPRPTAVPQGYTPNILVIEWLTLNCVGDWACRAGPKGLLVRFADPGDGARAVARFVAHPDVVTELGPRRSGRAGRARLPVVRERKAIA